MGGEAVVEEEDTVRLVAISSVSGDVAIVYQVEKLISLIKNDCEY
jgi:activator of HSP90 ATPase